MADKTAPAEDSPVKQPAEPVPQPAAAAPDVVAQPAAIPAAETIPAAVEKKEEEEASPRSPQPLQAMGKAISSIAGKGLQDEADLAAQAKKERTEKMNSMTESEKQAAYNPRGSQTGNILITEGGGEAATYTDEENFNPTRARAALHLVETSCTKFDPKTGTFQWRSVFWTSQSELGQYGVGVQLYFNFLCGLAIIFMIMGFMVLPLQIENSAGHMHGGDPAWTGFAKASIANLGYCGRQGDECENRYQMEHRCRINPGRQPRVTQTNYETGVTTTSDRLLRRLAEIDEAAFDEAHSYGAGAFSPTHPLLDSVDLDAPSRALQQLEELYLAHPQTFGSAPAPAHVKSHSHSQSTRVTGDEFLASALKAGTTDTVLKELRKLEEQSLTFDQLEALRALEHRGGLARAVERLRRQLRAQAEALHADSTPALAASAVSTASKNDGSFGMGGDIVFDGSDVTASLAEVLRLPGVDSENEYEALKAVPVETIHELIDYSLSSPLRYLQTANKTQAELAIEAAQQAAATEAAAKAADAKAKQDALAAAAAAKAQARKDALAEAAATVTTASAVPKDKPCPEDEKLRKFTPLWGNLDAGAILMFFLFSLFFDWLWVEKIVEDNDAGNITPADYGVLVKGVPRKLINGHQSYEQQLKEHLEEQVKKTLEKGEAQDTFKKGQEMIKRKRIINGDALTAP